MNCYDDSQLLCNGQRETVQYIHDMYHPTTPGTREHRRFLGLGGVRDGVTHPLHHYHIQLQPLPPFWSADTDQPLHRPHMVLTLLPSLRNLPSSCVSCAANQGVGVKRPCPHSVGDGSNLGPSRALRRPVPGVGRSTGSMCGHLGDPLSPLAPVLAASRANPASLVRTGRTRRLLAACPQHTRTLTAAPHPTSDGVLF